MTKSTVIAFCLALFTISACTTQTAWQPTTQNALQRAVIHFDTAKSYPNSSEAYFLLGRVAQILEVYPEFRLLLVGHTDAQGVPEKNKQLALDRANQTALYMKRFVPQAGDRIRIAYYGQDKPAYSNKTEQGRAKNRRVEVFLYQIARTTDENQFLQQEFQGRLEFSGQAQGQVQGQGFSAQVKGSVGLQGQ